MKAIKAINLDNMLCEQLTQKQPTPSTQINSHLKQLTWAQPIQFTPNATFPQDNLNKNQLIALATHTKGISHLRQLTPKTTHMNATNAIFTLHLKQLAYKATPNLAKATRTTAAGTQGNSPYKWIHVCEWPWVQHTHGNMQHTLGKHLLCFVVIVVSWNLRVTHKSITQRQLANYS